MSDSNVVRPLPDDGRRGPRLEIDEFLLDNEMTNLFLLALSNLQKDSLKPGQDGKPVWTKFYAIGAIHGQPLENWAGVPKTVTKTKNGTFVGYCHHQKNMALHDEMVRLADTYPTEQEKSVYQDAAARFRLPYWDLIMPRNELKIGARRDTIWGFPEVFKNSHVFVRQPVRDQDTDGDGYNLIANPLFTFKFPTQEEHDKSGRIRLNMDPSYYNIKQTTRIPGPQPNATTNNTYCDMAVQRQAAARATMIWHMLNPDITDEEVVGASASSGPIKINDHRTWEQFANRGSGNVVAIGGRRFTMPSLESWHDGIHVLLGTGQYYDPTEKFGQGRDIPGIPKDGRTATAGQMGNPTWAAFDPVFFLHHCNIDRLLAIYQALFPDKYCNAQDSATELLPFLNGRGPSKCYTSADPFVKDYWRSGFAVPGNTPPDVHANQASVREALKTYLNDTYFWATNDRSSKDTLPNWPKNLTGSWALHGPQSVAQAQISRQFTSIAMREGVPEVLAQEFVMSEQQAAESVPLEPHEQPVLVDKVLAVANSINKSLPRGSFMEPSAGQVAIQVTWNARVKVRKYAFDGSFSVHLFIGGVKDNQPERFMTKKNEVGFAGIFARGRDEMEGCPNCAEQVADDIVVEDVIPLTTMLYDYLQSNQRDVPLIQSGENRTIRDLTPESVVPFLKAQLQWRMIDLTATLLAGQEQRSGLEITITSRSYTPPTADNIMGVYGQETVHPEITRETPGGFGYVY